MVVVEEEEGEDEEEERIVSSVNVVDHSTILVVFQEMEELVDWLYLWMVNDTNQHYLAGNLRLLIPQRAKYQK